MSYTKPWKSIDQQLDLLRQRGMLIDNPGQARCHLQHIGYYRLSGYWYAFRQRNGNTVHDDFRPGTTFQNIIDLCVFDQRLRMLAFEAVERIEVAFRVEASHALGKLDRFAHTRPELFDPRFSCRIQKDGSTCHQKWLEHHERLVSQSREQFIDHMHKKYGPTLAIWVACEVWDFGALSRLYSGMRAAQAGPIARRYQLPNGKILASWLRSLRYLRNVCAHYSRLWNRNIIDQPRLPCQADLPWLRLFEDLDTARSRSFLLLCLCRHLLATVSPEATWPGRVQRHLMAFPRLEHAGLSLKGMGAPLRWDALWQEIGRQQ